MYGPTRFLQGKREVYNNETGKFDALNNELVYDEVNKKWTQADAEHPAPDYAVASTVYDYYEMDDVNNPAIKDTVESRLFMKLRDYKEKMMPAGTAMVPRVFKTNVGDIFTTNMINADRETLKVGDVLTPGAKGILEVADGDMKWQVVKVYTMPDHQKGVKLMRIA